MYETSANKPYTGLISTGKAELDRTPRQEQIEKSLYDIREAVESIEAIASQLCAHGQQASPEVRQKSMPAANISSLLSDLPVIIGQLATRIRETRNILSDGLL